MVGWRSIRITGRGFDEFNGYMCIFILIHEHSFNLRALLEWEGGRRTSRSVSFFEIPASSSWWISLY